jgi:hypothetical protein
VWTSSSAAAITAVGGSAESSNRRVALRSGSPSISSLLPPPWLTSGDDAWIQVSRVTPV